MSTVFRVEKKDNYTVMANIHLKDRRLSLKSKGLLSLILSLPPDWDYTITGLSVLTKDGVGAVREGVKELEKYGYVTRRQLRDERGRMAKNEYIVYENPADNPDYVPSEENAPANNAAAKKPKKSAPKKKRVFSVSSSAENPSTVTPTADNTQADTIEKLNKNILNTNKSIHSFTPAQAREDGIGLSDESRNLSVSQWEQYSEIIRENIRYEDKYAHKIGDSQQVDELVSIMTDVVCSSSQTIRVNGEDVPHEVIKSRFLKLTDEEIDYVLHALEHNSSRIRNMRSYLITMLYNSKSTASNYYANMAYNDIREGVV